MLKHRQRKLVERCAISDVVLIGRLHAILIEVHVQDPMKLVFNGPMTADDAVKLLSDSGARGQG